MDVIAVAPCCQEQPCAGRASVPKVLQRHREVPKSCPAFSRRRDLSDCRYDLEYPDGPGTRPVATGMHACIGKDRKALDVKGAAVFLQYHEEFVPFPEPLPLNGKVLCHCGARLRRRVVAVSWTGGSILGALHRGSGPSGGYSKTGEKDLGKVDAYNLSKCSVLSTPEVTRPSVELSSTLPSETCAAMQSMSARQAELEMIKTDGADPERERERALPLCFPPYRHRLTHSTTTTGTGNLP